MTVHDWIEIIGFSTVVIGWFVNSYLNRRHEIAKKRMEYRMDALQSFLPLFFILQSEVKSGGIDLNKALSETRTKFQLYCNNEEINAYECLIQSIAKRDDAEFTDALRNLIQLVREGIRKELGLTKYQYPV